MIKQTNYLVAGDVMASGELVENAVKSGKSYYGSVKMAVTLRNLKTNHVRVALWNYYGTVALNSSVTTAGIIEKPHAPLDFSANHKG